MTPSGNQKTTDIAASTPKIGIVAIGRNEGSRLKPCLNSLLSQSSRVIYADSASSDGSVEVARGLGIAVVQLAESTLLSAAAGRVAGYEALRLKYPDLELVQFIDGDCLLDEDWLDTAHRFLISNPKAGAVCGRRHEALPNASLYNAMADAEWDTPVGQASACGGDALYRVSAYEQAGGFRSDLLAGEEPELCARLREEGWEIWRIDARMTEHDARMLRFSQWWRRSSRGGYGYAQVWDVTRSLYGRQLASAFAWALVLPLFAVALSLIGGSPWFMAAIPIAFAVQAGRIYAKLPDNRPRRMGRAILTFLAKIPETAGAIRYLFNAARPSMGSRS